jgi:DNA processing protein
MTDTIEKPTDILVGHIKPNDEQYPDLLRQRYGSKAPELWYRGDIGLLDTLGTSVSVTGSRASTGYGEHVAMDFAAGFVSRGYTVITGGGYGIEGMATRATLACGGNAIVVNPAGLDNHYPTGHDELFRRVANSGLLLSLFAPNTGAPSRKALEKSGRLLAKLSTSLVVVESGYRGRSFQTADYALRHRMNVCAVPGPITSGSSAGTHKLITLGATLVTSVADVMDTLEK